jgi:hypothetical protein
MEKVKVALATLRILTHAPSLWEGFICGALCLGGGLRGRSAYP